MFRWFKKDVEKKSKCKHYSGFGEPFPENMKTVISFQDTRNADLDYLSYSVLQCTECGKRAFRCCGTHLMGPYVSGRIDEFIEHKIELDDLVGTFKKFNYSYKLEENNNE